MVSARLSARCTGPICAAATVTLRAISARAPGDEPAGAGILDRSAIAPIARGESAYDRAVREALANEGRTTAPSRKTAG